MSYLSYLDKVFDDHVRLVAQSQRMLSVVNAIVELICCCLEKGGTIFWYGNGGSAADAQHMAAELVSRFKIERKAIRSIALTTDTSILTAIANDYSYDQVFKRQVEALVSPDDVCIAFSTSGNSKNVFHAHQQAKLQGAKTVSLLGNSGGIIKEVSDLAFIVPSSDTPRIQEVHTLVAHAICELTESVIVKQCSNSSTCLNQDIINSPL